MPKSETTSDIPLEQQGPKPFVPDIDGYYDRLLKEAPYIPGDKMDLISVSEIPWADKALLKQGLQFWMRNVYALILAGTSALMFGFSVKPESVVLLRTKKFNTPESSFLRYISTGRRIASWFRFDITDDNGDAIKNIKVVRKMHRYYAKSKTPLPTLSDLGYNPELRKLMEAIRTDLKDLEIPNAPTHLLSWDPPLQISQLDMALTQFGFLVFVFLFPDTLGVADRHLMDGYIHYWAVLGRLLGLEDRFNLALHPDKKIFQQIYDHFGMYSLKTTDERVICMQESLMEGLSMRLPFLRLKSWYYYGLTETQKNVCDGKEVWKLMNLRDKTSFYAMKATNYAVSKFVVVRIIVNVVLILLLQFSFWMYLPRDGCPLM